MRRDGHQQKQKLYFSILSCIFAPFFARTRSSKNLNLVSPLLHCITPPRRAESALLDRSESLAAIYDYARRGHPAMREAFRHWRRLTRPEPEPEPAPAPAPSARLDYSDLLPGQAPSPIKPRKIVEAFGGGAGSLRTWVPSEAAEVSTLARPLPRDAGPADSTASQPYASRTAVAAGSAAADKHVSIGTPTKLEVSTHASVGGRATDAHRTYSYQVSVAPSPAKEGALRSSTAAAKEASERAAAILARLGVSLATLDVDESAAHARSAGPSQAQAQQVVPRSPPRSPRLQGMSEELQRRLALRKLQGRSPSPAPAAALGGKTGGGRE